MDGHKQIVAATTRRRPPQRRENGPVQSGGRPRGIDRCTRHWQNTIGYIIRGVDRVGFATEGSRTLQIRLSASGMPDKKQHQCEERESAEGRSSSHGRPPGFYCRYSYRPERNCRSTLGNSCESDCQEVEDDSNTVSS